MTALRREAIQMVEQMPEEQMQYIIHYMHTLKGNDLSAGQFSDDEDELTPKMRAFLELEEMLVPIPEELDYDKELEKARQEKYGYTD